MGRPRKEPKENEKLEAETPKAEAKATKYKIKKSYVGSLGNFKEGEIVALTEDQAKKLEKDIEKSI